MDYWTKIVQCHISIRFQGVYKGDTGLKWVFRRNFAIYVFNVFMFNLFTEFTVSGMSSVSFVSCVVLFHLLLFLIYFVNSESMDIVMMIEKKCKILGLAQN